MKNICCFFVLMAFICTGTNQSKAQSRASVDSFSIDTRSGPTWAGNGIGDYASGVFVSVGDTIRITASGSFYNGKDTVASPDGWPNLPDPQYGPTIMPDRASNALLGGIGVTSDQHFVTPLNGGDTAAHGPGFVGSNFYGVANDQGQIYFAINDMPLDDNVGQLAVKIVVAPLTGIEVNVRSVPTSFTLIQNYPNPFNPSTIISYDIPKLSHVTLAIYDILGRQVENLVNGETTPGRYQVTFDASGLPSGIYFYRLQAGTFTETKKLTVLK